LASAAAMMQIPRWQNLLTRKISIDFTSESERPKLRITGVRYSYPQTSILAKYLESPLSSIPLATPTVGNRYLHIIFINNLIADRKII
jgi:hypothetical protein